MERFPSTPHLPFSPEVQSDDSKLDAAAAAAAFVGRDVIVTEKLDGGNCCMFRGKVYARTHKHEATHAWFGYVCSLFFLILLLTHSHLPFALCSPIKSLYIEVQEEMNNKQRTSDRSSLARSVVRASHSLTHSSLTTRTSSPHSQPATSVGIGIIWVCSAKIWWQYTASLTTHSPLTSICSPSFDTAPPPPPPPPPPLPLPLPLLRAKQRQKSQRLTRKAQAIASPKQAKAKAKRTMARARARARAKQMASG
jgi:hypothetical protein